VPRRGGSNGIRLLVSAQCRGGGGGSAAKLNSGDEANFSKFGLSSVKENAIGDTQCRENCPECACAGAACKD